MERKAPLAVSAALVATLGLGIGGFAASSYATEIGAIAAAASGQSASEAEGSDAKASIDLGGLGSAAHGQAAADAEDGTSAEATADGATAGTTDEAAGTEEEAAGSGLLAGILNGAGLGSGASDDATDTLGDAASAEADATDAAPTELSDDPFAMQFSFDDTVIQLPCKVSDLLDLGFAFDEDDEGDVLEDGYSITVSLFYGDPDDYAYITCGIYNISGSEQVLDDCMVESVSMYADNLEDHDIEIAGGIELGDSTRTDVEGVYGPCEDPFEDGDFAVLDYESPEDSLTYIEFDFSGDELSYLRLKTNDLGEPAAPSDSAAPTSEDGGSTGEATGEGSGSLAERSTERVSPAIETLSDDPYSFQASIDGTIVQLPCYVADLQAIGFMLEDEIAGDILEDGYQTGASMYYGDPGDYIYVTATIYNASGSELPLDQCKVSGLSFHADSFEGHTVELPGGITLGGTTPAEALVLLGEPAFAWQSDDGDATSYDFNPTPDDFWRTISLWFEGEELVDISLSTVEE